MSRILRGPGLNGKPRSITLPFVAVTGNEVGAANVVFQRVGTSKSVAFSGASGSFDALDVRVEGFSSGVVAAGCDWTPATLSGGAFNCTLAVPQGGPYLWKVRDRSTGTVQFTTTRKFHVGAVFAASGQSLATEMFFQGLSGGLIAGSGATIPTKSYVFASDDVANNPPTTAWELPSDTGTYQSAFAAEFLHQMETKLGIPCALIGHSHGAQAISAFAVGQADNTFFHNVIAAAGGAFEGFIWCQGHQDGAIGTTTSAYQTALTALVTDYATTSSASFNRALCTIPTINGAGAGTQAQINAIRKAAKQVAAASPSNTVYVDGIDVFVGSGVHPTPAANVVFSRHFARALLGLMGLGNGDAGPVLTSASRGTVASGNSGKVTLNFTNPGTLTGSYSKFVVFAAGGTATQYTTTGITINSGTQATLTIASPPGDGAAVDVYYGYPYLADTGGLYNADTADGISSNGREVVVNTSPITAAGP